jgi:porin
MKHKIILALLLAAPPLSGNARNTNWLEKDSLTGNWGGYRQQMTESGVVFEAVYTADYFSNRRGGAREGGVFLDNTDIITKIDTEQLLGWKGGRFNMYVLGDSGGSPGDYAGDLQGVDNIDSPNTWKVYELWYEQKVLPNDATLRFGLYDLNSEFDVMETAGLFINSSFGIGADFSQSGQNGPSIFPTTSLGLRLYYPLTRNSYAQAVVLDGVPGDPNNEKGTHIDLNSGDGLLYTAEFGYTQGTEDGDAHPYAKLALGVWRYSGKFDDLVDTGGSGEPVRRNDDQGLYMLGEYAVFREAQDTAQGLNVFARYGIANADINPIGSFYSFGVTYTGLLPGRNEDRVGIAVAKAVIGSKYKQVQSSAGQPVDNSETIVEVTYRINLIPWLVLQPDAQWIINPGVNPNLKDAFEIGLRTEVAF